MCCRVVFSIFTSYTTSAPLLPQSHATSSPVLESPLTSIVFALPREDGKPVLSKQPSKRSLARTPTIGSSAKFESAGLTDSPGGSIRIFANSRNYHIRAKTQDETKVRSPPLHPKPYEPSTNPKPCRTLNPPGCVQEWIHTLQKAKAVAEDKQHRQANNTTIAKLRVVCGVLYNSSVTCSL